MISDPNPQELTALAVAKVIHASLEGSDPSWEKLDKKSQDKFLATANTVRIVISDLKAEAYVLRDCLSNFIYGVEHGDDVFTAMRDWVQSNDLIALAVALDLDRGRNNPEYKTDLEQDNPLYYVVPYIKPAPLSDELEEHDLEGVTDDN